jgi:hypothetical protein
MIVKYDGDEPFETTPSQLLQDTIDVEAPDGVVEALEYRQEKLIVMMGRLLNRVAANDALYVLDLVDIRLVEE